jgi:hypothetical protein
LRDHLEERKRERGRGGGEREIVREYSGSRGSGPFSKALKISISLTHILSHTPPPPFSPCERCMEGMGDVRASPVRRGDMYGEREREYSGSSGSGPLSEAICMGGRVCVCACVCVCVCVCVDSWMDGWMFLTGKWSR